MSLLLQRGVYNVSIAEQGVKMKLADRAEIILLYILCIPIGFVLGMLSGDHSEDYLEEISSK